MAQILQLQPYSPQRALEQIKLRRARVALLLSRLDQQGDTLARTVVEGELVRELTTLARFIRGQKARVRAKHRGEGVAIDEKSARVKRKALQEEKEQLEKLLGEDTARSRTLVQLRLNYINRRLRLLEQKRDLDRPPTVSTSVPRTRLRLPSEFDLPAENDVIALVRAMAHAVPRKLREEDRTYLFRLRAYILRALVRLVSMGSQPGVVGDVILLTLAADADAIETEVLAGGLAADPEADSLLPILVEQEEVLDSVVYDLVPEAVEVRASDAPSLVAQAAETEAQLSQEVASVPLLGDGSSLLVDGELPAQVAQEVAADLAETLAELDSATAAQIAQQELQAASAQLAQTAVVATEVAKEKKAKAKVPTAVLVGGVLLLAWMTYDIWSDD